MSAKESVRVLILQMDNVVSSDNVYDEQVSEPFVAS